MLPPPPDCTSCPLGTLGRTAVVVGDGPVPADVMVVGEAPGAWEDRTGIPMSSPTGAGALLDELLARSGVERRRAYVTNIVLCRPPQNRDPEQIEIDTCTELYLHADVERVNPRIIIAVGRFAAEWFLPSTKLSKTHGIPHKRDGRVVLPVYHPAAALHNRALRSAVERDFTAIPDALALAATENEDVVVLDGIAPRAALMALDTETRLRDGVIVCYSTSIDGNRAYVQRDGGSTGGIPTRVGTH